MDNKKIDWSCVIPIVDQFLGIDVAYVRVLDWNYVMSVVEMIEIKTGTAIEIKGAFHLGWWYSPKKTGTFQKGAGGGGGETVNRTPFEPIFGKYHSINVYFHPEMKSKVKENEYAESKINAVIFGCYRWIEWYNRVVLKSE